MGASALACPRNVSICGAAGCRAPAWSDTRLNSCFSWKSETLPARRAFENCRTSTSFESSARRPSMRVRLMTSSPTAFIMRSSHSSEMRTDFACGKGLRRSRPRARRNRHRSSRGRFHDGRAFGFADIGAHQFRNFFRREIRDAREKRIDRRGHFGIARPLPVEKFLQDIDGLQKQVDDFGAGLQRAVAQAARSNLPRDGPPPKAGADRPARPNLLRCASRGTGD